MASLDLEGFHLNNVVTEWVKQNLEITFDKDQDGDLSVRATACGEVVESDYITRDDVIGLLDITEDDL